LNADSSRPTYQHADEIRKRKLFAEVRECFWKEEPNFRQVLRQVESKRIYVVPNFISSGYFTEEVIPRELGLEGPMTRKNGQEIYYCEPVGLHPSMIDVLLERARQVVASSNQKLEDLSKSTCLFICGHGTSLNDNSTKIIYEQIEKIKQRSIYADCQAVFMEQKPFVKDWQKLTSLPNVFVVPFFISDGLHSFEDIPVLLGMKIDSKTTGPSSPQSFGAQKLWYGTAVGTEPMMADVILAQVKKFDETHRALPTVA
jgi:sirohydrochlorin cobaltochelatase